MCIVTGAYVGHLYVWYIIFAFLIFLFVSLCSVAFPGKYSSVCLVPNHRSQFHALAVDCASCAWNASERDSHRHGVSLRLMLAWGEDVKMPWRWWWRWSREMTLLLLLVSWNAVYLCEYLDLWYDCIVATSYESKSIHYYNVNLFGRGCVREYQMWIKWMSSYSAIIHLRPRHARLFYNI